MDIRHHNSRTAIFMWGKITLYGLPPNSSNDFVTSLQNIAVLKQKILGKVVRLVDDQNTTNPVTWTLVEGHYGSSKMDDSEQSLVLEIWSEDGPYDGTTEELRDMMLTFTKDLLYIHDIRSAVLVMDNYAAELYNH